MKDASEIIIELPHTERYILLAMITAETSEFFFDIEMMIVEFSLLLREAIITK